MWGLKCTYPIQFLMSNSKGIRVAILTQFKKRENGVMYVFDLHQKIYDF